MVFIVNVLARYAMAGAPKKYRNEAEREEAAKTASAFMKEIKMLSGMTAAELAEKLDPCGDLSEGAVRQYIYGKPLSDGRMLNFARMAAKNGWVGEHVMRVLEDHDNYYEISKDLNNLSADSKKLLGKAERASLKKLEQSVTTLIQMGWSDADLVAGMVTLVEKMIPEHARTGGGMVNPAKIKKLADHSLNIPAVPCISWKLQNWTEFTPG